MRPKQSIHFFSVLMRTKGFQRKWEAASVVGLGFSWLINRLETTTCLGKKLIIELFPFFSLHLCIAVPRDLESPSNVQKSFLRWKIIFRKRKKKKIRNYYSPSSQVLSYSDCLNIPQRRPYIMPGKPDHLKKMERWIFLCRKITS